MYLTRACPVQPNIEDEENETDNEESLLEFPFDVEFRYRNSNSEDETFYPLPATSPDGRCFSADLGESEGGCLLVQCRYVVREGHVMGSYDVIEGEGEGDWTPTVPEMIETEVSGENNCQNPFKYDDDYQKIACKSNKVYWWSREDREDGEWRAYSDGKGDNYDSWPDATQAQLDEATDMPGFFSTCGW